MLVALSASRLASLGPPDRACVTQRHAARGHPDRVEGQRQAQHRLHAGRLGEHAVQLPAGLGHRRRGDARHHQDHPRRHRRDRAPSSRPPRCRPGSTSPSAGAIQPEYNGSVPDHSDRQPTTFTYHHRRHPRHPGDGAPSPTPSGPRTAAAATARRPARRTTPTTAPRSRRRRSTRRLQPPRLRPERQLHATGQVRRHAAYAYDRHRHRCSSATRRSSPRSRPIRSRRRPRQRQPDSAPSPFRCIATPTGRSRSGGPASNLALADVADVNGENKAGRGPGDWCRINGTEFATRVRRVGRAGRSSMTTTIRTRARTARLGRSISISSSATRCSTATRRRPSGPATARSSAAPLGGTPTCGGAALPP